MLSEDESEKVKKNVIQQIESSFPEDKKATAIAEIEAMSPKEIEDFIEKNTAQSNSQGTKCIFCSIVFNEIPSHKISENSEAVAVLEINPISKGHSLIIPKKHLSSEKEISKSVLSLAKSVSKKIKSKFSPKDILSPFQNMMGHEIISIIPIYKDETQNSKRRKASEEELAEMQKILSDSKSSKQKSPVEKKPKPRILKEKNIWLPRRLP